MDKETVALIIAQNGLKTAATILAAKAAKQEKKAATATDPAAKTKLAKDATKTKKLAAALSAADQGITTYITETQE
ncbi:MAG: hypothetical protein SF097_10230 [Acidobacteriota bacterium]|nr:hypothetical protein [Acidobacteriota bacterium]